MTPILPRPDEEWFGARVARASVGFANCVRQETCDELDTIEGQWKQVRGKVKEKWGKLTDDELDQVAGKKDQLVGKLQEKYGYVREQAEREADEFYRRC